MPEVIYTVHDRGVAYPVTDAERVERLSHAGLRVTAEVRA